MRLNKYQCLTPDVPPYLPGNEILLNEENEDNPETTDTSEYGKDDMSHTNQNNYIAKVKDTNNINDDDEYKEDTSKHQDGNGLVDNPETKDTLCDENIM